MIITYWRVGIPRGSGIQILSVFAKKKVKNIPAVTPRYIDFLNCWEKSMSKWHQQICSGGCWKGFCRNSLAFILALVWGEQSQGLYLAFAEPTKDSSTASHKQPGGICINLDVQISLWTYFAYFVMARGNAVALGDDKMSKPVTVKNSPKQGYVLAQLLFTVCCAALLLAASGSSSEGRCFNYFIGGRIAKLERCQAKSKVKEVLPGNLPFAADRALGVQGITDGFDRAAMAQPCHKHKANNAAFFQAEACWASSVPCNTILKTYRWNPTVLAASCLEQTPRLITVMQRRERVMQLLKD